MAKSTKWLCAQRRLRSAWASVQSDQSLRCQPEESSGPQLLTECTAKILIRLGGCGDLSEYLLGAQSFCWFCHEMAQLWWLWFLFVYVKYLIECGLKSQLLLLLYFRAVLSERWRGEKEWDGWKDDKGTHYLKEKKKTELRNDLKYQSILQFL